MTYVTMTNIERLQEVILARNDWEAIIFIGHSFFSFQIIVDIFISYLIILSMSFVIVT